jgi:DegV family protein with EDD domain
MTQQVEDNNDHRQATGLVVDSTASLDPDFTLENDISVVQFKAKWEKVDQKISDQKISIYQKMKLFENQTEKYGWPKTSQPSPQAFLNTFKEQLQKYNIVICITASSAISGSYNSSLQARSFLPTSDQNRVIIPDFRQVGPGQGFLTIRAVELIKQGYSPQQIEKTLFSVSHHLKVFVIPDKISWAVKV